MVDVGGRLDDVSDPSSRRGSCWPASVDRFEFKRGIVLGASDGRMIALATHGTEDVPTTAAEPDCIVARAWDRHEVLPVKRLDAALDPFLTAAMPGARNVLVAPMVADGRPVGAIVVESARKRRLPGVERRVRLDGQPVRFDGRAQPSQRRAAATRPGPGRARLR